MGGHSLEGGDGVRCLAKMHKDYIRNGDGSDVACNLLDGNWV